MSPSCISYTRLHMCTTASVHVHVRSAASLHLPPEPTQSGSSVPSTPLGSEPNPATRRRRSINTHGAAERTPPRCMHHLPLVTAHTVLSLKGHAGTHSAPVSPQVHTDIKNVQSHLFTCREGAAVPAGGGRDQKGGGGGGNRSAVAARTEISGHQRGTYVPKTIWNLRTTISQSQSTPAGRRSSPGPRHLLPAKGGITPPKTETLTQCPAKSQPPLIREN